MKWLKRKDIAAKLGVSYNHIRLAIEKDPEFPRPIRLSEKVIVFDEGAVEDWMRSKSESVNNITSEG